MRFLRSPRSPGAIQCYLTRTVTHFVNGLLKVSWLESQPVPVIVVIGYMLYFAIAATTFIAGWLLSRTKLPMTLVLLHQVFSHRLV